MTMQLGDWARHLAEVVRLRYGLDVIRIETLDLGADAFSNVFKVEVHNAAQPYFLKTRPYAQILPGVDIPAFFSCQNIPHILAPIPDKTGQPWVQDGSLSLMLYPFLSGTSAMDTQMTPRQWTELGQVMRAVHACTLPSHLAGALEQEVFSAESRLLAESYLHRSLAGEFAQTPGAAVADVLCRYEAKIRRLLNRAGELGAHFREQPLRLVPCHADLHKWNIFIVSDEGWVILDWDTVKLAPHECDLMYIGGNIGGDQEDMNETPCFYEGYGESAVNRQLITYYRCERILVDIAEFGKQIWGVPEDTAMNEAVQATNTKIAGWIAGNFAPGNEYDTACQDDL